jgi:hypothetical protein
MAHQTVSPDLWDTMAHRWELASDRGAVQRTGLCIDGNRITLELVGEQMSEILLPPLQHLITEPATAPDLTIRAWEAASTGVELPAADPGSLAGVWRPWRPQAVSSEAPLHGTRMYFDPFEGTVALLNEGSALYFVQDLALLPDWSSSVPFLHLFHWWLATRGVQLVHAGAVGRNGRGVMVVGPAGAGKTTTTLAGVAAGMDNVGDDRILLSSGPSPRAVHLYASAKLVDEADGYLARALPPVENPQRQADEKALYLLRDHVARSLELRAIVAPVVTGQPTASLEPISAGEALLALAPNTIAQFAGAGARAFGIMRETCSRLPCYRLSLGDARSVGDALESLLAC